MLCNNNATLESDIWKFADIYQRSRFLFGPEVSSYLKEILDLGFEVQFQKSVMNAPQYYEDSTEQIGKYAKNMKWSNEQLDVIFVVFAPYLSFDRAK